MLHPYSTWLAPGTPVFGNDPDSDYSSEGSIPRDTFVLINHPFPERGEIYVQSTVREMRRVVGSDNVIRVEEIDAGEISLNRGGLIYVHKDFVTSKERVIAPELSKSALMERLL